MSRCRQESAVLTTEQNHKICHLFARTLVLADEVRLGYDSKRDIFSFSFQQKWYSEQNQAQSLSGFPWKTPRTDPMVPMVSGTTTASSNSRENFPEVSQLLPLKFKIFLGGVFYELGLELLRAVRRVSARLNWR
jgi:hypothetical protein